MQPRRWLMTTVLCALTAGWADAEPGKNRNIFDDDWTPATRPSRAEVTTGVAKAQATTPTTPTTGETTTEPKPPAVTPPLVMPPPTARLRKPIPSAGELAKSRKLFKEVFADALADRSAKGRRELGEKCMDAAATAGDVPADQFALFAGAIEAGQEAGDLRLCFRAADAMAAVFDVDALSIKCDAAAKASLRGDSPATRDDNCRLVADLVDQLVEEGDFTFAGRLSSSLRSAGVTDAALVQRIQRQAQVVDVQRSVLERLGPSYETLKHSPDDPGANLVVGKALCLTKGDWERGLPMLAKGSDPALKAVAKREMAQPSDGKAMSELAGQWWDLAEKEGQPLYKSRLKNRAAYWYEKALPDLTGLNKALAEKRLGEVAGQTPTAFVPNPAAVVRVKYASGETELDTLRAGVKFFVKPSRPVQAVPAELEGLSFSRRAMGATADVTIEAPAGATVYLLVAKDEQRASVNARLEPLGWKKLAEVVKIASPSFPTYAVYKRTFATAQTVTVSGGVPDSGVDVAAAKLEVESD